MIFDFLNTSPLIALSFVLSLVICITVHEFAHALAGYWLGDMTARDAGRLTLNPLAHLDPLGSIMLLFAGFGWGRPTPYNPYNLKYPKWGPAIVAIAGPISNLIMAIVSLVIAATFEQSLPPDNLMLIFLSALFFVNVMLMVFNLIPIPPLDGSQILFTVLPPRFDNFKYTLAKNGPIILFALIIIDSITNIGIFSSIYGWFLNLFGRVI